MEDEHALVPLESWQTRTLMIGGLLGAVLGILSAYLYIRSAQAAGEDSPPPPETKDAVKLGMSLLSIIRSVAELGRGG